MPFDWTILLIIPGLILGLWAQAAVKGAYTKYGKVPTRAAVPAQVAVEQMLHQAGNDSVLVRPVGGELTDHYDPRDNTLSLSEGVYGKSSVAAVAIAAHEAGHAQQQHTGYAPLKLRSTLVPAVNIGSNLSMPIFIAGLLLSYRPLVGVGIALFALAVLMSLVTLPVELDASRRALQMITTSGQMTTDEMQGAKKVLRAAAMTYVAAALSAVMQLIRLILISRQGSSRRD